MKAIFQFMVVAFLAVMALPVQAEVKIGYVNIQRLLTDAPQAIKAGERIKKEFEKREQEIKQLSKQLETMQSALQKNSVTMSETERRNKDREISEFSRDLERKGREFREDLTIRRNEETNAVFEAAGKAVRKIGEQEKFTLIVQEAPYINPVIDITDKVIKVMNEGAPAAK